MTVLTASTLMALAYQITPSALQARSAARAPASLMQETRLNNYVLPGPMKPLGNQVMIKLRKIDDRTTGGLFVPTAEVERPKEGIVVLAGPGKPDPTTGVIVDCPVKEGDLVLLSDYSGETVDYNGEKHIFCDADSLLGGFDGADISATSFKPLGDLLMLAMADMETETSTGIALAGMEEEEGNSGKVVAAGPGCRAANGELIAPSVAVGESVMYMRRMGAEASIGGKTYIIVSEADCLVKW